jgi:hypothetical protein
MISLASLVLPIVVSAIAVFFLSFLVHMVLKYHTNDMPAVPNEDGVMDALRKFNIPPGDYMMPRCKTTKEMKEPAFIEKMKKGPVVVMTVMPSGEMSMGKSLVQWFIYCLIVGVFTAFVTSRSLGAGQPGDVVMLLSSVAAFMGYALAQWQNSIWYRRKWSTTIKNTFDGVLYGLATGAVFALMWPKG